MNIKVRTNISNEFQDIEVCINAPEKNEEVQILERELLAKTSKTIKQVVAMQNNDIFIINTSDIILFYSEEKNNFCKTKDGSYRIKEKLYYLEELLSTKDFVRISNSAIININHVKCFNTSIIGKIIVKFKDGSEEVVSKRRTKEIMKFLKDRFIMDIPVGVLVDSLSYMNPDSEELIEMGNKYQESLEIYIPAIQEKKELYGDDYPAEALLIYQVINWFQIRDIVKVYLISLLIGVILGTIMYIVVLQKTQKKQMIIELIIAFAIFVSVMKILNVGYGIVINKVIQSIDAKSAEAYVDNNINTSTLMIIYGIIAVGIYIVNMIRQKITTKELNKELNNK